MSNIRYEYPAESILPLPTEEELGWWYIVVPEQDDNLVANPSFELATSLWSGNAGGEGLAVDRTRATHGCASLKVTPVANTASGTYCAVTLTPGSVYTIDLDVQGVRGIPYKVDLWDGSQVNGRVLFTGTGGWQHLTLTVKARIASSYILITKNGTASVAPFYIDSVCCVNRPYRTTYLDGTQGGCSWLGSPHASVSRRSPYSRAGGKLERLTEFRFHITSVIGGGAFPVNPVSLAAGLTGGGTYQRSIPMPRDLTLVGRFVCNTAHELQLSQAALIDAVKPNSLQSPVRLIYQPRRNNAPHGDAMQIDAVYTGGLEGIQATGSIRSAALSFRIYEAGAIGRGVNDQGKELQYAQLVATANFILQRDANGQWAALGGGLNATVVALARGADGSMYAAGFFTDAGGVAAADYIAQWNGSSWAALGTSTNGIVECLAVGPDGSLYAGGIFTAAGGVANTSKIAKWNGSAWSALGTGCNDEVQCMAFGIDGSLYVGGKFTSAGGVANTAKIAKWNGSAWVSIATGGANDHVDGMTIAQDGSLYVGGAFTTIGGVSATRVAHWDGTTWYPMGTGASATVYAMATGLDGKIYAGGNFVTMGGLTVNYIAMWNGSQWSAMGAGFNAFVYSLEILPNGYLLIGGTFANSGGLTFTTGMSMWTGSTWTMPDLIVPGTPSSVEAIDYSAGVLTIGYLDFASAWCAGITSVNNEGNTDAYPVIKIKGPGIVREITNFTTGDALYFNLTLAAEETATLQLGPQPSFTYKSIAMSDGAMVGFMPSANAVDAAVAPLRSTMRRNLYNTLLPGSNLQTFRLIPGTNSISLFITSAGAGTLATIQWSNQYDSLAALESAS